MGYLSNFFVSIDQLGNVIAGGNPDNTISSRIGFYTEEFYKDKKTPSRWTAFKKIIDFAFYPIDGKDHCKEAYYNDVGEEFDEGTNDFAIAALTLIIFSSCILISILLYILYGLGVVSPRKINRSENIKERLRMAEAKLRGVYKELNDHRVKVDEELDEIIDDTQNRIGEIARKIDGILDIKDRLKTYKKSKVNKSDEIVTS